MSREELFKKMVDLNDQDKLSILSQLYGSAQVYEKDSEDVNVLWFFQTIEDLVNEKTK